MTDRGFNIYFRDPKTGDMRPAVWRDKAGAMHRAVGADQSFPTERIRLIWTACQKHDIPANGAWLQNPGDLVTCDGCKQAGKIFDEEEREEAFADGQFGVGA